MDDEKTLENNPVIETLFGAGAHFALGRSRRHPTAAPFIFGAKNRVEIFDLELTTEALERAKEFVRGLAAAGKQILFVGCKHEGREAVKRGAEAVNMPYVAGRWLGGTITNFPQMRKRIERLEKLVAERDAGELGKYTKKERLLIDREIIRLEGSFGGLVLLKQLPAALLVIDSKHEHTAIAEAKKFNIPVVSVSNSDCDFKEIDYPIPGNDGAKASIEFFVNEIVTAYREGKNRIVTTPAEPAAPLS